MPTASAHGRRSPLRRCPYFAYLGRHISLVEAEALTPPPARAFYRYVHVEGPGFGRVLAISAPIAEKLVDTGVNCGVATAAIFLQRALNALNRQGALYADIAVDGDCGPATLRALKDYLVRRTPGGERVLLVALNCLQGERYIDLAEKRPKDEAFLYGWLRRESSSDRRGAAEAAPVV